MIVETIAEIVVRIFLEGILYGLTYYTGYALIRLLTFGRLRLAPLELIWERNPRKEKILSLDWSPWLHQPKQKPFLRAEIVCLVGLLAWIGAGIGIYQTTRPQIELKPSKVIEETAR